MVQGDADQEGKPGGLPTGASETPGLPCSVVKQKAVDSTAMKGDTGHARGHECLSWLLCGMEETGTGSKHCRVSHT